MKITASLGIIFLCLLIISYAGFSEIMATLSRIGFFSTEAISSTLNEGGRRLTFQKFLLQVLSIHRDNSNASNLTEKEIAERIIALGLCKEKETAIRTAKTIM